MNGKDMEVSVVLPCLNEERTLGICIREAKRVLEDAGIKGEVIVSDNGSTDRSRDIAVEEKARLVEVAARGYGNALYRGFMEARGKYIVFLDADMSYDFSRIPSYVMELRAGADLVMGSRFRGRIYPGAMPLSHRLIGTPILTFLANLFFGCGISDINCGMRGLSKAAFERLQLRAGGMEFASEMVIKAALLNMNIVEIPTDLRPDQREGKPHLRAFRDGWRHLRFMLLFCPTWLFFVPGLIMTLGGMAVILAMVLNLNPYLGFFSSLASLAGIVLGVQILLMGIATRGYTRIRRFHERNDFISRFTHSLTLEKGILAGGILSLAGFGLLVYSFHDIWKFMHSTHYVWNQIDVRSTKLALLGATFFVTGIQIVFSSFFLCLFNIEPLQEIEDKDRV